MFRRMFAGAAELLGKQVVALQLGKRACLLPFAIPRMRATAKVVLS